MPSRRHFDSTILLCALGLAAMGCTGPPDYPGCHRDEHCTRRDGIDQITGGLTHEARAGNTLELAEAQALNHTYVGTEHILLGLRREGEGVAVGSAGAVGLSCSGSVGEAIISVAGAEITLQADSSKSSGKTARKCPIIFPTGRSSRNITSPFPDKIL